MGGEVSAAAVLAAEDLEAFIDGAMRVEMAQLAETVADRRLRLVACGCHGPHRVSVAFPTMSADASSAPLSFHGQAFAEMIGHAYDGYPLEACGLLVGSGSTVQRFVACTNEAASARVYSIPPREEPSIRCRSTMRSPSPTSAARRPSTEAGGAGAAGHAEPDAGLGGNGKPGGPGG